MKIKYSLNSFDGFNLQKYIISEIFIHIIHISFLIATI